MAKTPDIKSIKMVAEFMNKNKKNDLSLSQISRMTGKYTSTLHRYFTIYLKDIIIKDKSYGKGKRDIISVYKIKDGIDFKKSIKEIELKYGGDS